MASKRQGKATAPAGELTVGQLQNVLARFPGATVVTLSGSLSVDGVLLASGTSCAAVAKGTKGAAGVLELQ